MANICAPKRRGSLPSNFFHPKKKGFASPKPIELCGPANLFKHTLFTTGKIRKTRSDEGPIAKTVSLEDLRGRGKACVDRETNVRNSNWMSVPKSRIRRINAPNPAPRQQPSVKRSSSRSCKTEARDKLMQKFSVDASSASNTGVGNKLIKTLEETLPAVIYNNAVEDHDGKTQRFRITRRRSIDLNEYVKFAIVDNSKDLSDDSELQELISIRGNSDTIANSQTTESDIGSSNFYIPKRSLQNKEGNSARHQINILKQNKSEPCLRRTVRLSDITKLSEQSHGNPSSGTIEDSQKNELGTSLSNFYVPRRSLQNRVGGSRRHEINFLKHSYSEPCLRRTAVPSDVTKLSEPSNKNPMLDKKVSKTNSSQDDRRIKRQSLCSELGTKTVAELSAHLEEMEEEPSMQWRYRKHVARDVKCPMRRLSISCELDYISQKREGKHKTMYTE